MKEHPQGELIQDIPFEEYLAATGINASGLKHIARSPAHYRASLSEPPRESTALTIGKLTHLAILEPARFNDHAVVMPKFDMRKNVDKAAFADWKAALAPDAIEVPEYCHEQIQRMTDKVQAHPAARRLLEKGVREGTFFWTDPDTGELCKGRPDFVSGTGIIVDLKTTQDARNAEFSKSMWTYRYDIQAAHYCAGSEVTGIGRADAYAFLVVEKEPPYEIGVYTAGASVLGVGRQWRREAMATYAECRRTGIWPGYPQRAEVIELPAWAKEVETKDE